MGISSGNIAKATRMWMYISSRTVAITVNYTNEFRKLFVATAYYLKVKFIGQKNEDALRVVLLCSEGGW